VIINDTESLLEGRFTSVGQFRRVMGTCLASKSYVIPFEVTAYFLRIFSLLFFAGFLGFP